MGWKTVKETYGIEHIVHVRNGDILIGSPYISNIVTISPDGEIKKRYSGGNEDLTRVQSEMDADPAKLLEAVRAKDIFSVSNTVYTYNGGEILEKQCESYGWPNITHDGCLMYENTFSPDRREIILTAKREAAFGIKSYRRMIKEKEQELQKLHSGLAQEFANLKQLRMLTE